MKFVLGQIVQSFFNDYLPLQRGLRQATIRSYRDTMKLFLRFTADSRKNHITKLLLPDLTFEIVLSFLNFIEKERANHVRSRNQRLAALRTFFRYVATRAPEMLETCQRIDAISQKRASPPETNYLDRDEVKSILCSLPKSGRHALRNRTIIMFLYNTGARVQEAVDLRVENLELGAQPFVHLHGKGDKWRTCPLWQETTKLLRSLLGENLVGKKKSYVFCSRHDVPLTRFGVYKIVRKYGAKLDINGPRPRRVSPHIFRHTAAVHLLESGVEINVIRGWLGHVDLETTNRYAELTLRAKEEALRRCEPEFDTSEGFRRIPIWRDDEALLHWLDSL